MSIVRDRLAALLSIHAASQDAARSTRRRRLVALGLLGALALAAGCGDLQDAGDDDASAGDDAPTPALSASARRADLALERLAFRRGAAPGDLQLAGAASSRDALRGRAVHEFKALDLRDGTMVGIALDDQGDEVDVAALRREEEAARAAVERRADPALAARLAGAQPEDLIEVSLWVKETGPAAAPPRPAADRAASHEEAARVLQEVHERRAAQVRGLVAPVRQRLTARGFAVEEDGAAPVLRATLPARVIEELRGWPQIDRMYVPQQVEAVNYQEVHRIYAPYVHGRGIRGDGVPVAEIEVGGQIHTANPFLAGVTQDTTYSCVNGHATAVAGIIRSTDGYERGVAPGANLWVGGSCGGWTSELNNRASAAAAWGARAFNLSYGSNHSGVLTEQDRYWDDLAINLWRSVVVAAGNAGNAGHVISPATAFNVIAVGSYDEGTQLMSGFSSGVDPISAHSDRQKPEVVAPGESFISTTHASPWLGAVGSGTSYAAPLVTGTVALLMQRRPALQYWPETVRAIVMTSALWDNHEGDARLSDLDGAGGIDADFADRIADSARGRWGGGGFDCSWGAVTPIDGITLAQGLKTRVVLSWQTDPTYASYASQPSADLDLIIKDPSGNYVASSASWDNATEVVDFYPSVAGVYTVELSKYRCDLSPRFFGLAWFQ